MTCQLLFKLGGDTSLSGVIGSGDSHPVAIFGIRLFEVFAGGNGCFFNMVAFVYVIVHFQPEFPSGGRHKLPQARCSCRRACNVVQIALDDHQVFEVVGDTVCFQYRFDDGKVTVGALD